MKAFDTLGRWNWIDKTGCFVGFDSSSQCCEWFGFVWRNERGEWEENENPQSDYLAHYTWDPSYFWEGETGRMLGDEGEENPEYAVEFRAVSDSPEQYPPLTLRLLNAHNGYYSHAFAMGIGGDTVLQHGRF